MGESADPGTPVFDERFEYLRKHGVVKLFDSLILQLMGHKPSNPVAFLRQWCERHEKKERQSVYHKSIAFSRRSLFLEMDEAKCDPVNPPQGIYGCAGATAHRRSLALGIGTPGPLSASGPDFGQVEMYSDDGSESGSIVGTSQESRKALLSPPEEEDTAEAEIKNSIAYQEPELHLYALKITTIPRDVFSCTFLQSLDLSDNAIRHLPEEIGQLVNLERLSLRSNELQEVPAAVASLPNLSTLFLDQNRLESIPECFGDMKLSVLGLDWNDLLQFPVQLCRIEDLDELYLIENPSITSLPMKELQRFKNLTLALDNFPSLVKDWSDGIPTVTVEWNKVFPDLILPGVYLGSLRSAQYPRVYSELGITHLASIGRELQVVLAEGMQHIQLNVSDLNDTNLAPVFPRVHSFMQEAVDSGTAVLVHCFKGQSRSATCVISYCIQRFKWSYQRAFDYVKEKSPRINPNPGFRALLQSFAQKFDGNDHEQGSPS